MTNTKSILVNLREAESNIETMQNELRNMPHILRAILEGEITDIDQTENLLAETGAGIVKVIKLLGDDPKIDIQDYFKMWSR